MTPEKAQIMAEISQQTIYVMGGMFVLGSMVTLLMLIILDFIRRNNVEK